MAVAARVLLPENIVIIQRDGHLAAPHELTGNGSYRDLLTKARLTSESDRTNVGCADGFTLREWPTAK